METRWCPRITSSLFKKDFKNVCHFCSWEYRSFLKWHEIKYHIRNSPFGFLFYFLFQPKKPRLLIAAVCVILVSLSEWRRCLQLVNAVTDFKMPSTVIDSWRLASVTLDALLRLLIDQNDWLCFRSERGCSLQIPREKRTNCSNGRQSKTLLMHAEVSQFVIEVVFMGERVQAGSVGTAMSAFLASTLKFHLKGLYRLFHCGFRVSSRGWTTVLTIAVIKEKSNRKQQKGRFPPYDEQSPDDFTHG